MVNRGSATKAPFAADRFRATARQGLTTWGHRAPYWPKAARKIPSTLTGQGSKSASSGTLVAGNPNPFGGVPQTPVVQGNGEKAPAGASGYGNDWFEKIHIVPRDKLEFGNILSAITEEFEIYNASFTPKTLANIVNEVTPGMSLPDFSSPLVVPGHRSILRDFATFARTRVIAEQDGLPVFDGRITFDFTGANDVFLELSGVRIVLMPFEYEQPFTERLGFLTDVLETIDGNEQRISLRDDPRQEFQVRYRLDSTQRQRMQNLLFDFQAGVFGVPMWHDAVRLQASASAGATSLSVLGASDVGFRNGFLAAVIQDDNVFDVVTLTSVSDTTLGLSAPLINSYTSGVRVVPIITAYIDRSTSGTRWPVNLEEFQLTWRSTDNSTGALQGTLDATGRFWSTYNGKPLLDDCNVIQGANQNVEFPIRIYKLDNRTGAFRQGTAWDTSKRSHSKGFIARSRAEVIQLRELLLGLRGSQKSFYIPTFIEDITPVAPVTAASSTIDIDRNEYDRHARNRLNKDVIRATFTNGTQLIRVIQSSQLVSTAVERLTLDAQWGSDYNVDEFVRIEFFELVRFETDDFDLNYQRPGLVTFDAPVRTVFDSA